MKKNTVFALVLFSLAVFILSGCASEGYNTQKGAAIGAGLGAIAGQVIGHDTASTLVGAGVGTLVGAVAGNAVDQHAQKQQGQGNVAVASPPGGQQEPPGRWVEAPGQWIGGKWVPAHSVWVPVNP